MSRRLWNQRYQQAQDSRDLMLFLREMDTDVDSYFQLLFPFSSITFHQRRPTRSLPVMFLTVQKSQADRRMITIKDKTKLLVNQVQKRYTAIAANYFIEIVVRMDIL